jgi:hypothetical protein
LLPRGGFALRRFGVSPERSLATSAFFGIYLEKGGRLGLKCLLLSYFRVGDHPPPSIRLDERMGGQLSPSRLSIARTAMNQPRPRRRMSRRYSNDRRVAG